MADSKPKEFKYDFVKGEISPDLVRTEKHWFEQGIRDPDQDVVAYGGARAGGKCGQYGRSPHFDVLKEHRDVVAEHIANRPWVELDGGGAKEIPATKQDYDLLEHYNKILADYGQATGMCITDGQIDTLRMTVADDALRNHPEVRKWLDDAAERMRTELRSVVRHTIEAPKNMTATEVLLGRAHTPWQFAANPIVMEKMENTAEPSTGNPNGIVIDHTNGVISLPYQGKHNDINRTGLRKIADLLSSGNVIAKSVSESLFEVLDKADKED